MEYSNVLSEKKTAWAIVLLYITLIFMTIGDVVPIVNFATKKLGNNFNLIMSISPYIFFSGFFVYVTAIKKERRLTQYIYYILILIAFFLVMRFLRYPVERIHLIEYSIFGALFFWMLSIYGLSLLASYTITVFATLLVGGADEIVQSFIPTRFFDFRDILINFQSGILGAAVYAGFVRDANESEDDET
jgi:VanZ family protein